MNLTDKFNSIISTLRGWIIGAFAAVILFAAQSVNAATVSIEDYSYENLESPYDSTSYQFSLSREFIPVEPASWIDEVIKKDNNCTNYISVLEQFISCSPSLFDSDLISESEDKNKSRSTGVEQSS